MNEAGEVRWVGMDEASQLVKSGDVIGAASVGLVLTELELLGHLARHPGRA